MQETLRKIYAMGYQVSKVNENEDELWLATVQAKRDTRIKGVGIHDDCETALRLAFQSAMMLELADLRLKAKRRGLQKEDPTPSCKAEEVTQGGR